MEKTEDPSVVVSENAQLKGAAADKEVRTSSLTYFSWLELQMIGSAANNN